MSQKERPKIKRLSPEIRELIWKESQLNTPSKDIARQFNISTRTVQKTIQNYKERKTFESKKGAGRIRSLDDNTVRYLIRLSRRFPEKSYKELGDIAQVSVTPRTIARCFSRMGIRKVMAKNEVKN